MSMTVVWEPGACAPLGKEGHYSKQKYKKSTVKRGKNNRITPLKDNQRRRKRDTTTSKTTKES
jgi:hypothetical protein